MRTAGGQSVSERSNSCRQAIGGDNIRTNCVIMVEAARYMAALVLDTTVYASENVSTRSAEVILTQDKATASELVFLEELTAS